MKATRWALFVVAAGVAGVLGVWVGSSGWTLQAQDRKARAKAEAPAAVAARTSVSVQDAMLRPVDLPFDQETTLDEVRLYLTRTLNAPVVLDRGALDRLELTPDVTVRMDLKGVRLKVALKLLLDQVGLAYKVVPEDNLLILTDPESTDDTAQRVLSELKSLHREMHDLQDAVEDLRDLVEEDLGVEPERPRHQSTLVRLNHRGRVRHR